MNPSRFLWTLFGLLAVVAVSLTLTTFLVLYDAEFDATRERLAERAKLEAHLFSAILKYHPQLATLEGEAFRQGLSNLKGGRYIVSYQMGSSGEVLLGKKKEGGIHYLLPFRYPLPSQEVILLEKDFPMSQAISGSRGIIRGPDYRGVEVLAAYQPVGANGWGLVAKKDLSEVRAPYLRSGGITGLAGLLVMALSALAMFYITRPVIQAAKAGEQRLKAVFETAAEGFITINERGIVLSYNRSAENIFGYSAEEVEGKNISMLMPEPHASRHDQYLRNYLLGGAPNVIGISREMSALKKGGQSIWIRLSVSEVFQGSTRIYTGVINDMTVQKHAVESLQASELRYRGLVDTTVMGIIIHRNFRPLFANQAFASLFGYSSPEEIIALGDISPLLFGDDAKTGGASPHAFEPGSGRSTGKGKDGQKPHYQFEATDIIWNEEKALQMTVLDLTQYVLLEAQLREQEKMEAVGQMTGGVAHEFNNLHQIIGGYVQLAQIHSQDNSDLSESLGAISGASERASKLISQMLAFGQKRMTNRKPEDLNEVIYNTSAVLRSLTGKAIDLQIKYGEGLRAVLMDREMISDLLFSMVFNGKDAMGEGGTLTLETRLVGVDEAFSEANPWAGEGPYALLRIADTGEGMTEEVQAHIFEPFFTTKDPDKGSGLGLAMAYGVVTQHQGHILVESAPGEGTEFSIYLPLSSEATKPASSDESKQMAKLGKNNEGKETILLAEDDALVLEVTANLLIEKGYKVFPVSNGAEAIDFFTRHGKKADLALLDIIMPEKNGREVYEALQKNNPEVKVIFFTGYASNIVDEDFLKEQGLKLVTKPFSYGDLLSTIREVLDQTV